MLPRISLVIAGCVVGLPVSAYQLSMLGQEPDWSLLDPYQGSIRRSEFENALDTVYLPYGYDSKWIQVFPEYALILTNSEDADAFYRLRFSPDEGARKSSETGKTVGATDPESVLNGLKIAIDPGHIGGRFSEMEGRHFQIGEDPPVKEGDLTLLVSKKLMTALESLGAEVVLVRQDSDPVTDARPADFLEEAEAIEKRALQKENALLRTIGLARGPPFEERVRERAEMLFYRVSEIHARAQLINQHIKPDLTLAVHFNVSPWQDGARRLHSDNHIHVIVNGTYTPTELALDDVRLRLFQKLLSRNHEVEIPLSARVANALAKTTGLPPFYYGGDYASNQAENPYLWARNLLANRLYEGPVVYLEVYATNSKDAYRRVQMGDYEGLRDVDGSPLPSLFEEYTLGVVEGLVDYYANER